EARATRRSRRQGLQKNHERCIGQTVGRIFEDQRPVQTRRVGHGIVASGDRKSERRGEARHRGGARSSFSGGRSCGEKIRRVRRVGPGRGDCSDGASCVEEWWKNFFHRLWIDRAFEYSTRFDLARFLATISRTSNIE